MATDVDDEDEWEYEYSANQTESYLVDLDLSTANGIIKSKNAGERKSIKKPPEPAMRDVNSGQNLTQAVTNRPENLQNQFDRHGSQETGREEGEYGDDREDNSPAQAQSPLNSRPSEQDHAGRLQILDSNTANPIVSYQGHIYSCAWHDMLGTMMFVAKHQEAPFHEPQLSTEDFDLIGTSHIKLVGRRVRPMPKTGIRKRKRDGLENEEDAGDGPEQVATTGSAADFQQYIPDGRSLGGIRRTNARASIEIKQQTSFLEKLMEVKKARGETDAVRTFVDRHTVLADARKAKGKARAMALEKTETEEQRLRREIDDLNKRVVKGDYSALERLQEIYADKEDVEDSEE